MEYNDMVVSNPYDIAPAQSMSMTEQQRHDSGNALAANSEARVVSEVKAQVIMAHQFPRDPRMAVENILRECQRPTLANGATYSFPRGKETVSGPSIRLAEVMARAWGNCTYGMEVLERSVNKNGFGYSVIRTYAWDLETNTYISRQFELKHLRSTKSGSYKITDDRDIYELEANMASRRMRACILQMIPGDVTQMAVNACRQTASAGIVEMMADRSKRAEVVAKTLKAFERMGITQDDLEGYLSCMEKDWTADHMLKLKELKNGLEDGVLSIGELFPRLADNGKNAAITKEQTEQLMKLAKETGRQGDISVELKKMGISKFADVPATRFDEIKALVESFKAQDEPPKSLSEIADSQKD